MPGVPLPIRAIPQFLSGDHLPACKPETAKLFELTDQGTGRARRRIAKACAICDTCPLKDACGQYGVEHRESGVWGGRYLLSGRSPYRAGIGKSAA